MTTSKNLAAIKNTSIGNVVTILNNRYNFGDAKNVCECCGTYSNRTFLKLNDFSILKKGKKVCLDCLLTYTNSEIK